MSDLLRVAVIGAGHWGPNIARLFLDDRRCQLVGIADISAKRRSALADRYRVPVMENANDLLDDATVDAVVIATPAGAHYELARRALDRGKHVFVEKPITTSSDEGLRLCDLAEQRGRILMVGHVFLYNGAFQAMCQIVQAPDFGQVMYSYARRLNLGPIREDVHAGWDLATHDVSMLLALKGCVPRAVTASSHAVIRPHVADVVFATLFFADGTCAHIHASWLDPQKLRELVVVGEQQMVVFDDMNMREPIRIFKKSFQRVSDDSSQMVIDTLGSFRVELRSGEVIIPAVNTGEPLAREIDDFIVSVRDGRAPRSDGRFGVQVVRVLEAIDLSIARCSQQVELA